MQLVQTLAATYPNVTYGDAPPRAANDDAWVANHLRLGLDYLRYQHRIFDQALTLRERSRDRTPAIFVTLGRIVRRIGEPARRAVVGVLRTLERYVPEDPTIREFITSHTPDAVLITPLINLGSSQIEYQRAARGLGIPNALCVWSWDHLSSKALIRDWPDRVFVWNEVQRQEALNLHGVPARSHRRHRRAVFRSVVQPAALTRPGGVLRPRRAARRPAVRDVRVLDAVRSQPAGSTAGGRMDSAHARQPAARIFRTSGSSYGRIRRGSSSGTTST